VNFLYDNIVYALENTVDFCIVKIYIPYERTFSVVVGEKNGWWGDPF